MGEMGVRFEHDILLQETLTNPVQSKSDSDIPLMGKLEKSEPWKVLALVAIAQSQKDSIFGKYM